jgi:hypothetical protein
MSESERQSAIVPIFQNENGQLQTRRTYICFGVARGGTSAVAGTMQRLGVFMGQDLPNNYEDPCFGPGIPPAKMRETIDLRNQQHDVWGWKFPAAASYLEHLFENVRNPYLVAVFRDVAATMKGHVRWHSRDVIHAAQEVLLQQQKNWFLIERWRVPTLLVSYEKAVLSPHLFAQQLASHIGTPEPEDKALTDLASFLSPGSYK